MVRWLSVATWLTTAILGINLLWRGGVITEVVRRSRMNLARLVVYLSHVLAALTGLLSWGAYLFWDFLEAGWIALLSATLAAVLGLTLVARWVPGRGRHARRDTGPWARTGYFPVHAASAHAMVGAMTLLLVFLVVLGYAGE